MGPIFLPIYLTINICQESTKLMSMQSQVRSAACADRRFAALFEDGKYFAFSFLVLWKHIGSMGKAIRPMKKKNENLCFVKLLCVVLLCSW